MKKTLFLLTLTLVLALAAGSAWADAVIGLTTFTSGTPAIAASVNANFSEIQNSVDDNDTRVTALEDNVPGLASEYLINESISSGAFTTANSVTISAPGPGYILVFAQGSLDINHITGAQSYGMVHIANAPATANFNHQATYEIDPTTPSLSLLYPVSNHLVDVVASSGDYTYYLNIGNSGGTGSSTRIFRHKITAVFLPQSYGNVSDAF